MLNKPPAYRSYLLRMWQEGSAGSNGWRASLECPLTRHRHLFPSLEALVSFLRQWTAEGRAQDQDGDMTGQELPPT